MITKVKTLEEVGLKGKRVLLRAGFDVPLENGKIVDDERIKNGLPTLEYLLKQGASRITIIFHLDRPAGKVVAALSTQPVAEYLAKAVSASAKITVAENLRFDPREAENSLEWAKELAAESDLFVQDAFNTLYESDTSIVTLPRVLPSVAGLLVAKEIKALAPLLAPKRPFIVIVGGAKIATKLPLVKELLHQADRILIGGEIANDVLKDKLFADESKIILPVDFVNDDKEVGRDIGPKTIELFIDEIKKAQLVFWNGNLGMTEDKRYCAGSLAIAQTLTRPGLKSYAGGGDTAAFLRAHNLTDQITYVSSGGGATLYYLARKTLPGLEALRSK